MSERPLWRELGLTDSEYQKILRLMGREPNRTELGMFAALWSEHCAYKHSRHLFPLFPTQSERVLQGLGENAGVVDIGDGLAVTFKIESHNHPSAVEPYHGAATGVGGILRDIISMGARPVALLNSLRFGPLSDPGVRDLLRGVTAGMSDYANIVGVPSVGGEAGFDPSYRGNPLVNVMAIGLVAHEDVMTAAATGVGNPVMVAGGKTGRDGILGASFASVDLEEGNAPSQVQVGDPWKGRRLIEACLEAIRAGALAGIQDMGAAGLTSSSSEMAAKAGTGIEMDLLLVPRRAEGMTPYELMLSESQERMLLIPHRGQEEKVRAIFARWGLEAVVVGRVTDDGVLRVKEGDQVAAAIPARFLTTDEAPSYKTEGERPGYLDEWYAAPLPDDLQGDAGPLLLTLLAEPNIASKAWIYRQGDAMAQGRSVVGPGAADAAVFRVGDRGMGLAASVDCNALHCAVDPRVGAAAAVAECARNLACTGARPLALTDGMNFGNPERGEVYWQFEQAVMGIAEAARAFDTPVISGNVSFYNESKAGAIHPTPIIGMVGLIDKVDRHVTLGFKRPGDMIFLLGEPGGAARDLGGSRYLQAVHGLIKGPLPALDLAAEKALQDLVIAAAEARLLQSAHDAADGGLAVAIAESALAGALGARCTLRFADLDPQAPGEAPGPLRLDAQLFGEGYGRIVVSVRPEDADALSAMAREYRVPCTPVGEVTGERFEITAHAAGREARIDLDLESMAAAYRGAIPRAMDAPISQPTL